MQQTLEQQTKAGVESLVYVKEGRKFIALGNYALDFKTEYLYLGMTKTGQVILGEITQYAYNGSPEIIRKRYGKIYDGRIHAEGSRYIEKIPGMTNE